MFKLFGGLKKWCGTIVEMAPPTNIDELVEHVAEISQHLKDARNDLKAAIEKTELYDKIIKMTLKQSSTGCDIPDKAAKAHAYKITLAHYTKKESADTDS